LIDVLYAIKCDILEVKGNSIWGLKYNYIKISSNQFTGVSIILLNDHLHSIEE